jgi:hypothetical protein
MLACYKLQHRQVLVLQFFVLINRDRCDGDDVYHYVRGLSGDDCAYDCGYVNVNYRAFHQQLHLQNLLLILT